MKQAKQKVCVITSSRAEYSLLRDLIKRLMQDAKFDVRFVVTGTHLSKSFGHTIREIGKDKIKISKHIDISENGSFRNLAKIQANALLKFDSYFKRTAPGLVILLGDRYEIFSICQAAYGRKIPIAHIAGGDITEGALDEGYRHAITKMAHLHFVTNEQSKERVVQMGENPELVFDFGNPGLDAISRFKAWPQRKIEEQLEFNLYPKNILVTFHPETGSDIPAGRQIKELLAALERLGPSVGIIFTKANADEGGEVINKEIERFVRLRANTVFRSSLGHELYYQVMARADVMVGNSSSGFYEAPSFKLPTVNVGERQRGRMPAKSLIDCKLDAAEIYKAILSALNMDCNDSTNPYAKENAAEKIYLKIKEVTDLKKILRKRFYQYPAPEVIHPKTFIIAEAGVNHNGKLEEALKLVRAAKASGADAVKFQCFQADALVTQSLSKADYQIKNTEADETQWKMLRALELSQSDQRKIMQHCQKEGIEFLSSPFSVDAVYFLANDLKVRLIKIPSGELTNNALLLAASKTGLPTILSTGMATADEIERSLAVLSFGYCYPKKTPSSIDVCLRVLATFKGQAKLKEKTTVLHCISEYPAPFDELNLRAINTLQKKFFNLRTGFSDHSLGICAPIAAVARGACIIEKHLTLDKGAAGPDHASSLEADEFKAMVKSIREIERALGDGTKQPSISEMKNRAVVRRVLVANKRIRSSEPFSTRNVTSLRGEAGMSASDYFNILGKKARRSYEANEIIQP